MERSESRCAPGAEGPCGNAHHDSRKQSERREGGRPGCLLHGSGDHPLLGFQGILVGVLALLLCAYISDGWTKLEKRSNDALRHDVAFGTGG